MTGKQLKNSILQWAIQGKLVPQDPNDEPASVLLEKIRQEKERLIKEKKIKRDKNASIIYRGEDNSYYEKILATGEVKCIDEEIPFEVPKGWEWCRFSSLYFSLTDGTHSTPKYQDNGIPFMSVKDMSSGKLNFDSTKYISQEEHNILIKRCNPQKGDLLLSKVGTTGIPLIIDTEKEFSIFVSLALAKFSHEFVNPEYLIILIQSPLVQIQASENTRGVGNKNWVLSAISNTLMVLPPYKEQCRIVEKIRTIEPCLEKYTNSFIKLESLSNAINETLKKSILQEAIQGKLVPQDPSDEPASILLQRIRDEKQRLVKEGKLKKKDVIDSTIFRGDDNKYYEKTGSEIACIDDNVPFDLPTSWCWVRHNQLFEVSGGSQPPKSHFIDHYREGYIRLYQIRDYGSNPVPVYVPINEISKTTRKGDILLARYGGSLGKVFWAEEGAYNVAMAKVIPLYKSELIHKEYIFLYYCSNIYQSTILDHSRSAQAGFNKDDLADMLFPLPPYSEQVRIVERYQSIVTSIMSR